MMVLPLVTFLISNGNNIAVYDFTCFAAKDIKGRQVAIRNGAVALDNNTI